MEKPIRVLQVIGSMNLAGAETFIMNIYRKIDRSKVQFDFIVHKDGAYDSEIKKLGGRIYKISPLSKVGYKKYIKELKEIFMNNRYKIIHSHINETSGLILKIAKKCNIPIRISHSHNTGNHSTFIYKIIKAHYRREINKYATNFFACSQEAAKWLFKKNANKAIIVKNAIDTNNFAFSVQNRKEKRKEFNIEDSTILIGNIGRITNQKNQIFLIDIFKEINRKIKDSKLMIVGEGNLEIKLKNKVKKEKIENNVIFTGSRKDINELLSAFDIFVFPSLYEGLGIALIEAQSNGLLCFTSDVVPQEAKVTDNLVFVSLKRNCKYWADLILNKYKTYNRENQVEKVKEAGYDIEQTAKQMEEFYVKEGKE